MSETSALSGNEAFPPIHFASRGEFTDQLLLALRSAQREVWLADADFKDWPMNAIAVEEALRTFLLASRANRVHLLALNGEALAQAAPRFMSVLRLFGHGLFCRQPSEQIAARFGEECSFAIVDRARIVRRFHRDTMRGVAEFHPNEIGPWVDQFQSIWDDATPSIAGTTLGLG
jgi:hypothetical protein